MHAIFGTNARHFRNRCTPFTEEVTARAAGEIGDLKGEIKAYERALQLLPDCLMLHLALAERHEHRGNIAAAKAIYEDLAEKRPSPMVMPAPARAWHSEEVIHVGQTSVHAPITQG